MLNEYYIYNWFALLPQRQNFKKISVALTENFAFSQIFAPLCCVSGIDIYVLKNSSHALCNIYLPNRKNQIWFEILSLVCTNMQMQTAFFRETEYL